MIRILLAEDDNAMRQYLERALERAGYAVTSVDRGTAALPLLEQERFDLLLTDIVMPEMDGIELAQRAGAIAPDKATVARKASADLNETMRLTPWRARCWRKSVSTIHQEWSSEATAGECRASLKGGTRKTRPDRLSVSKVCARRVV